MKINSPIDKIVFEHQSGKCFSISIKRDDLLDKFVSGNKFYKLKLNVEKAISLGASTLITFGGAYSNHIAATAAYASEHNLNSVGIIRGEKYNELNPTLQFATDCGMQITYISRSDYRLKATQAFQSELMRSYEKGYLIPEGGANYLGIEGCKFILSEETDSFDVIAVAMGTGTTYAGLVKAAKPHQKIIGLPIHRHKNLLPELNSIDPSLKYFRLNNHPIIGEYHFGGYAKFDHELIEFIQSFYAQTALKLDPIYTAKALFGVFDLLGRDEISNEASVLFIHTGGIQGVKGFELQNNIRLFDSI